LLPIGGGTPDRAEEGRWGGRSGNFMTLLLAIM